MGNSLAFAVLAAWPLVTFGLFAALPLRAALIWSLLGGFLLLPQQVGVDLPGVPPLDRTSIPILSVILVLALRGDRGEPGIVPRSVAARVLILMVVAGAFATVLRNPDPLVYGPKRLPGLTLYDAASITIQSLFVLLPVFVGRRYLSRAEDHSTLIWAIFLAGLAYSLPVLFEVRMSPQLHNWIYGFFPHSWIQHKRDGGFRALVFMPHALWLSLFMAIVATAAAALVRLAPVERQGMRLLQLGFLLVVVILCKSVSGWALAFLAVAVVLALKPRMQLRVAALLVALTLSYPMLRSLDLFPTGPLLASAEIVSPERYRSLEFRFDNEDKLLDKAAERPLFGWGTWGRNRVYDERGVDETITDGTWIILFGSYGWTGFLGQFGLLALPVFLLWRRAGADVPQATAALAMALAINMVNLLPNSTLMPLTWLISGALLGYAERLAGARAPAARPALQRSAAGAAARPARRGLPDTAQSDGPEPAGTGPRDRPGRRPARARESPHRRPPRHRP